jgi:DNA-directed RNA polymerase specialized sigma subunit
MEYLEINETLQQFPKIMARINILKTEIDAIESTGISAISFDAREGIEVKFQHTTKRQMENIKNIIILLEQKIKIINMAILVLPELQQDFIKLKYFENKPYYQVCGQLNISERYARIIKSKAIHQMVEIMKETN